MEAAWGRPFCLIKVVVLGFFFCKDGDLPETDPSLFGRSDEFRKTPLANLTVHLILEFAGPVYSVVHTHAFIPTVWFFREHHEALICVVIR
jgi:hypothetical protein